MSASVANERIRNRVPPTKNPGSNTWNPESKTSMQSCLANFCSLIPESWTLDLEYLILFKERGITPTVRLVSYQPLFGK